MIQDLFALEHSPWTPKTRHDAALIEATFAPDFFECGRLGRRYSRADLLRPREARPFTAQLHDLKVMQLSETISLVTYLSEVQGPEGLEWGNRASLWDRASGPWQLRFHQGTPTAAKERT